MNEQISPTSPHAYEDVSPCGSIYCFSYTTTWLTPRLTTVEVAVMVWPSSDTTLRTTICGVPFTERRQYSATHRAATSIVKAAHHRELLVRVVTFPVRT